jgi:uncharacterized protein (TIGR00730 family)
MSITHVCVFCGSSYGDNGLYVQAAQGLGRILAARGITLVYGGGKVGLMGEIARSVTACGGQVIGVIPRHLADKEVAYREIDLRVVDTMHERKALMADLAQAFIALPGGLGTLEEISEVLTWAQLGLHDKPCGFLNINGYYDALFAFLDRMQAEQFIHPAHRGMVLSSTEAEKLLDLFEQYQPPKADKAAWALGHDQKKDEGKNKE